MKYFTWILFVFFFMVLIILVPLLTSLLVSGILCWKELVIGPVTAITVVLYSYFLAPKNNEISSVIGFIIGALIAYLTGDTMTYPECHELAYQHTYTPLIVTYSAGIATLCYCLYLSYKKNNN